MSIRKDERGSVSQRKLFDLLREIYPTFDVHWEYPIDGVGRIDLFVPMLGIAIEYDGRQHAAFVEHFHKDISGYLNTIKSDNKKNEYLNGLGIKTIRIPHTMEVKDAKWLKEIIDSTENPEVEYVPMLNNNNNKKEDKLKELRRKKYLKDKEYFKGLKKQIKY